MIHIFRLFFLIGIINTAIAQNEYIIETEIGDITMEVYPDKAPVTTKNFMNYIERGVFDSANFFRVVRMDNQLKDSIKIEVIQGSFCGMSMSLEKIPHETTRQTGVLHENGTVSMARGKPGSASSSFFICINDQPQLDFGGMRNPDGQGFAAFGKITKGMGLVKKIQKGETDHQTLKAPIKIKRIYRK